MCGVGVYIIIFISCITLYYIIYIALRGPILPPFYSTPFYPNCCRLQKTHGRGQEGAWGRFATPSKARFARSIPSPSYPILSHPIPFCSLPFPPGPSSLPHWSRGTHGRGGGSVHSTSLPPSVRPPGPKNIMYS